LKQFVAIDKDAFFEKAKKKDDPFEEISKRLQGETGTQISTLKIPGVLVYRDAWRTYPAQSLAAHTIGLMGYQGNEYLGRY
ncbi:hypothetical protein ABK046_51045, partial [Streptomyces caeruleatus]